MDDILAPARDDKLRCLRIATEALAEILAEVASAIDHKVALTIAIETINGMAKTAPMTERAMQQVQHPKGGAYFQQPQRLTNRSSQPLAGGLLHFP